MGRGHGTTRFLLEPVRNAIPLCVSDHDWFDTHKIQALILDPEKRVLNWKDESFSFLVEKCGYSWKDLELLLVMCNRTTHYNNKFQEELINQQLKKVWSDLQKTKEKK